MEAHLAGCPACRGEAARLGELGPLAHRLLSAQAGSTLSRAGLRKRLETPRVRWVRAAAAAILLAVGWGSWRFGDLGSRPVGDAGAPAVAGGSPFAHTDASDCILGLGRSGTLLVRQGSRLTRDPGKPVRLLSGALVLTARGEPCEVAFGGGLIRSQDGELVLETLGGVPRLTAWDLLLPGALAQEEAEARLSVLSGRAEVLLDGRRTELPAGRSALLSGAALVLQSGGPGWRGGAWRPMAGLPRTLKDGTLDLAPAALPGDYAWEAVFRRDSPRTCVSLRFRAGGQGWSLPLDAGLPGGESTLFRVGLEVRRGWVRLEVGGQEIVACPATDLHRGMAAGEPVLPGLQVWGGGAEVVSARWRTLP